MTHPIAAPFAATVSLFLSVEAEGSDMWRDTLRAVRDYHGRDRVAGEQRTRSLVEGLRRFANALEGT